VWYYLIKVRDNLPNKRKEDLKMTKTEMINYIEMSNMVIDFDRKYLMRKDKGYVQDLFNKAVAYVERQK
jgi:hypothetical protein